MSFNSSFGNRTSFGGGGFGAGGLNVNVNDDSGTRLELMDPPPDTVSAMAWSCPPPGQTPKFKTNCTNYPDQQRLAVASWDGSVRIYDIRYQQDSSAPQAQASAMLNIQGPCLDVALDQGGICFTAGADGVVKMHEIQSKQVKDLGKHEGPIMYLKYDSESQLIVSGGVDGMIKAFNGQGNCVHQSQMTGMIRCLDIKNGFIGCLTNDNHVHIFNTQDNTTQVISEHKMHLTHLQFTSFTLLPKEDKAGKRALNGFAVGSCDGRCSIYSFFHNASTSRYSTNRGLDSYNFACHPTTADRKHNPDHPVHTVSALDINHRGIMLSTGSNGTLCFWDLMAKTKKQQLNTPGNHPVVAASYDPWNRMIAYSSGYDWSQGVAGHNPQAAPPKVYVHTIRGMKEGRTISW